MRTTVRDRRAACPWQRLGALTGVLLLSGGAWAAGGGSAAAADGCTPLLGAMLEPFARHMRFAHLERSLEDQVKDATALDRYVDMHTTLVQTMLTPLQESSGGAAGATLGPFFTHLEVAHLDRSPEDQLEDARDVDRYIKTHTVLVETMAAPALGTLGECRAAPAPQVPGPAPRPEPQIPWHRLPPAPVPSGSMEAGVMIMGNAYAPGSVQVARGATVAWTNMDAVPHTVTGGPLQSSALGQGGVFTYTFDGPGTYAYYCAIHPDMKGAVVVAG